MTKQEQIEEIQKIIDDCWEFDTISAEFGSGDGDINIEEAAEALYNAGYRNISEYEAEIKRLEEKCEELLNEKWDAQDDLDCYYDEMPTRINQAVQDFADRLKTRLEAKAQHYIGMYDWNGHSAIVDCENEVDELLKEYEE